MAVEIQRKYGSFMQYCKIVLSMESTRVILSTTFIRVRGYTLVKVAVQKKSLIRKGEKPKYSTTKNYITLV